MKHFTTIETLSDGSVIKIGKPGITYKPGTPDLLYMFAQSGVVLAVEAGPSSPADHAVLTITSADGETVKMSYSFAYATTILADITDIVKSMVKRTVPVSSTPVSVGTALFVVDVELFDSDDIPVDNASFGARAIDGLDYATESPADGFWPGVPDRVRVSGHAVTFLANGSDGEATVTVKNGTNAAIVDNNGQAVTFYGPLTAYEIVDDGSTAARCIFDAVDCFSDKAVLRWWSPELGGWKSSVWDVVEQGCDVARVTLYDRMFARNAAAESSIWMRLRSPLCSVRDWAWLRDISISDEVEMFVTEKVETGGSTDLWRSVTVSPSSTAWKINDVKDFDIVVTAAEASSL